MSKHTGIVELKRQGSPSFHLLLDWAAISEAMEILGEDVFSKIFTLRPDKLAVLLAIALRAKHPGVTAEEVMEAHIPVYEAARAIDMAVLYAYHGPEQAEAVARAVEAAQDVEAEAAKKKTLFPPPSDAA